MNISKKTHSRLSILAVALFVIAAVAVVSPNSLLKSVAFGYGGGSTGGDITAPSISNIASSVTETAAAITWTTNESSISWVVYGTSTAYGLETKTTSYVTSHSVTLNSLSTGTTYHYQVKSKDNLGNIGTYTDKTFTTLAAGETPAETPEATTTIETETPAETPSEAPNVTLSTKPVSEMTVEEIKAEVNKIITLITYFQQELAKLQGGSTVAGIPAGFTFVNTLKLGMVSDEVKYLQIVLNANAATRLAESGAGSPGNETTYFGPRTNAAVIAFQEKYASEVLAPIGLTSGTGIVGYYTKIKLNAIK